MLEGIQQSLDDMGLADIPLKDIECVLIPKSWKEKLEQEYLAPPGCKVLYYSGIPIRFIEGIKGIYPLPRSKYA